MPSVPGTWNLRIILVQRGVACVAPLIVVEVPLLIMQGAHDRSIPPESVQFIFDHVGSSDKELAWFPNSGHAITVDGEREAVWARTYEFMIKHCPSGG